MHLYIHKQIGMHKYICTFIYSRPHKHTHVTAWNVNRSRTSFYFRLSSVYAYSVQLVYVKDERAIPPRSLLVWNVYPVQDVAVYSTYGVKYKSPLFHDMLHSSVSILLRPYGTIYQRSLRLVTISPASNVY